MTTRMETCPRCDGTGADPDRTYGVQPCLFCAGAGDVGASRASAYRLERALERFGATAEEAAAGMRRFGRAYARAEAQLRAELARTGWALEQFGAEVRVKRLRNGRDRIRVVQSRAPGPAPWKVAR